MKLEKKYINKQVIIKFVSKTNDNCWASEDNCSFYSDIIFDILIHCTDSSCFISKNPVVIKNSHGNIGQLKQQT